MSVQTDRLPPVPQLVAPLNSQIPGKWELKDLRFESSWLQWFIQLRAKVDVINESLVSFGGLGSGVGLIVQNGAGTFLARTVVGTSGRVAVANGSGETGNITIDISTNVGFKNAANLWTAGQTFNSDATFNGTVDFNLSPTYNVPDIINAVDDAAAATAGVPVGGTYRTGSVLKLRVV